MPPTHKKDSMSAEVKHELILVSISIFNGIAFTIGSIFFLPTLDNHVGDIIFVVAGLIGVFSSGYSLWLTCQWEPEDEDEYLDEFLPWHNNKSMNAIQTCFFFFLSNIIFVIGSIFFWPDIKEWFGEEVETTLASWGAWLFVFGSMGFALASFQNGMALGRTYSKKADRGVFDIVYRLKKNALLLALIGSIAFVVGSMLYRPGLTKSCTPHGTNVTEETVDPNAIFSSKCSNSALFGTWNYIIGSILFLLEALLDLAAIIYEMKVEQGIGEVE